MTGNDFKDVALAAIVEVECTADRDEVAVGSFALDGEAYSYTTAAGGRKAVGNVKDIARVWAVQ